MPTVLSMYIRKTKYFPEIDTIKIFSDKFHECIIRFYFKKIKMVLKVYEEAKYKFVKPPGSTE